MIPWLGVLNIACEEVQQHPCSVPAECQSSHTASPVMTAKEVSRPGHCPSQVRLTASDMSHGGAMAGSRAREGGRVAWLLCDLGCLGYGGVDLSFPLCLVWGRGRSVSSQKDRG